MDMNKILAAVAEGGMSVDEFVAKLREQEHTNRLKAEEEARLAAEAEKKVKRDIEAARARFITEIANKTLAHGLEASDVAWLFREYINQENHDLNQEDLNELINAGTIDDMASVTVEVLELAEKIEKGDADLGGLLSTLFGVSSPTASKSRAKVAPAKKVLSPDEILKNFVKTL
jgi:uncharacterized protein (DUF885 family)